MVQLTLDDARRPCGRGGWRNAIRYVLSNQRPHEARRGERVDRDWIDPFSSAY